jgi:hypothetical protein
VCLGNDGLNPLEWGWELVNDMFFPVKTSLPTAPDFLLMVIRCNCKGQCDSKRCSCGKHGLECLFDVTVKVSAALSAVRAENMGSNVQQIVENAGVFRAQTL